MAGIQAKATPQKKDADKPLERTKYLELSTQAHDMDLAPEMLLSQPIPGNGISNEPGERLAALVSDPRFLHSANGPRRAQLMNELQGSHGNTYVQRVLESRAPTRQPSTCPKSGGHNTTLSRAPESHGLKQHEPSNELEQWLQQHPSTPPEHKWEDFTPHQKAIVERALKLATRYVENSVTSLELGLGGALSGRIPTYVRGALVFYFRTTDRRQIARILDGYRKLSNELRKGLSFEAESKQQKSGDETVAYVWQFWSDIHIVFPVFEQKLPLHDQAGTIIHEASHKYLGTSGGPWEIYDHDKTGRYYQLTAEQAMANADSYAGFAIEMTEHRLSVLMATVALVNPGDKLPWPKPVQPKLTVNPPDDQYEREADRVAATLTQTPESQIQRQPKEEEEEKKIQAKAAAGSVPEVSTYLESRINAARGSGQPLPESVRASVEPHLGQDLSGVRIHTDAEANRLSEELQASAFTTGQDVFFRDGAYQPDFESGKNLLGHELTHVVQQGAASPNYGGMTANEFAPPKHHTSTKDCQQDFTIQLESAHTSATKRNAPSSPMEDMKLRGILLEKEAFGVGHKASIFFATKKWDLDFEEDIDIMRKLFDEYEGTIEDAGEIKGYLVGHADRRRSVEPNNEELSKKRAEETKRKLELVFRSRWRERALLTEVAPPPEFDFAARGEGTVDVEEDAPGKENDPLVLASHRRVDIFITTQKITKKKESGKEPEKLSAEQEKEFLLLIKHLKDAGTPDSFVEYIKSNPEVVLKALLEGLHFAEIAALPAVGVNLLELATAFELALTRENTLLAPFACKGWAYGATAWVFHGKEETFWNELCANDLKELTERHESDKTLEATNIWRQSVRKGYDELHKLFRNKQHDLKLNGKIELVRALWASQWNNDPKKMAKQVYDILMANKTAGHGEAIAKLESMILRVDYPK